MPGGIDNGVGRPAPPFTPGNRAAERHGAQSEIALAPRATEFREMLRAALPDGGRPLRDILVAATALNMARIERAERWLGEQADSGLFVEGKPGRPQPILVNLATWQAELRRQIAALEEEDAARRGAAAVIDLAREFASLDVEATSDD